MNGSALILPRSNVPPGVLNFADAKGVSNYLDGAIDLVRQAFPSSAVDVAIGQDAEQESHQYIALDVEASGCSAEDLITGQRIWSAGITRVCPAHIAIYFVLGWR